MKIIDCYKYKDGGTILVETDMGRYWIPHHSIGIWKGESYFRGGTTELVDNEDEISSLIKALAEDSEMYRWIKRRVTL